MPTSHKPLAELPFPEASPPALREAVAALVRAKAKVDRLALTGIREDRELATRCGLPTGEDGTAFFREIFPFAGRWDPIGATEQRKIPLDLVMGHSWRWHPEHVAQEERAPLRERLLSRTEETERAEVCWIVPLGLFLAHEGKNRIEFLRSEGATHYPALTTPYDYPTPDRMQLIQVPSPHGDVWWAILDHDVIEPLHCPEWSLPILAAYGVSTTKGWPENYPTYAAVRREFDERSRRNFRPLKEAQVSLKGLQAKEEMAAKEVFVSLIDLPGVRLRKGWKIALAALMVSTVVAALVIQPQLHDLSIVSACLGAALMLTGFVFAEILVVPQRKLDSQEN